MVWTKRVVTVALAVALSWVGASIGAIPQQTPSLAPGGDAALSQFLSAAVDRGDVPGVVALVVNKDGVLYERAFGKLDVARNVAMPANAIFRIASMTKPVTSAATMMLVESGQIALDDPIAKYLPEFENREVVTSHNPEDGTYQTRPAARPITIRHLLTNTSGLGYGFSNPVVAQLQQITMRGDLEIPLVHDPGARWTYGGSTRVLGQLVEKLSGQPLDVFMKERMFDPLGMTDTAFAVPADRVSRVATSHRRVDGALVETANGATQQAPVRGDGGLFSTARDYGQFVRVFLNGGSVNGTRILGERWVTTMGENHMGTVVVEEQPAVNAVLTRPFPLGAGRDTFGLGFQVAAADDRYAAYRRPGSLSWAGISNTHFWIDPAKGIGAVFLVQVLPFYDEQAMAALRGFEELVYRHVK